MKPGRVTTQPMIVQKTGLCGYSLRVLPSSAMISCPIILVPSYWTSIRRVRVVRVLATTVASSVVGNKPTISHLFWAVCAHSSYCFHLAINNKCLILARYQDVTTAMHPLRD